MKNFIRKCFEFVFKLTKKIRLKVPDEYFTYFRKQYHYDLFVIKNPLHGENINFQGSIHIDSKKGLLIGNCVEVGHNCYFNSIGGVVIGDGTKLGQSCFFYTKDPTITSFNDSIYLGKNVRVGNNVTFLPGSIVPDNQIVPSCTVVNKETFLTTTEIVEENENDGENMFFIVSTGRSGSASIADFLSNHPEIECLHEPRYQLIRISTLFEYGVISYKEVLVELKYLFKKANFKTKFIYGESDQKLSNLIKPLHVLFPKAKFVWLLRDGKKVVESTTIRGWYSEESIILDSYRGANKEGWKEYRLERDKILKGDDEWSGLTPFEKNCWYWYYWNHRVELQFNELQDSQKFILHLEQLSEKSEELQEFLGVRNITTLPVVHKNKGKRKHMKVNRFTWTEAQENIFTEICGPLQSKFYKL